MSSLAVRRFVRRRARRVAVLFVLAAITGAVVAHHSMPEMSGMAAGMACAALVVTGTVAVHTAALVRPRLPVALQARPVIPAAAPARVASVPARAGPFFLEHQVLRR